MDNSTIVSIFARETFSDSGYPAIEVAVTTKNGAIGLGSCSESYSTSDYKPKYLYDGGERFHGLGLLNVAKIINTVIAPALIGMNANEQMIVDQRIKEVMVKSGIPNYVNITSPVSIAVLHAGAESKGMQLYRHIGGQGAFTIPVSGHLCACGSMRYSETNKARVRPNYMLVAYDFPTFDDAHYALWETVGAYEKIIAKKLNYIIHRGFSMAIPKGYIDNDEIICEAIAQSIKATGYEGKMGIHIDIGANEYYNAETGLYEGLFDKKPKTREDMIRRIEDMAKSYPLVIIGDPLEQNDLEGYAQLARSTKIQVTGDDIFSSDVKRIEQCVIKGCVNSVVLPVNRFETFSDAVKVVRIAKNHGADVMVRDLCGEGYDTAAYATGFKAGTIFGSGLDATGNFIMLTAYDIGPRVKFYGKSGLKGKKFALKSE